MRRLVLVVAAFAVVALGALTAFRTTAPVTQGPSAGDSLAAPTLAAGDTAGLPGPRQPVFFRHDIHAGQYKIQCQYCHFAVEESQEPGIPSMQTCMGCHLVIVGTDSATRAEIAKVRDANAAGEPIEWNRVYALARHAHFPHMRHVKALGPNACMTCHGDVARMPQIFEVNKVSNMGWCVTCHLERNVSRDCSVCHY